MDVRLRIVAGFGFIAVAASLKNTGSLLAASAFWATGLLLSGISPRSIVARLAAVLPFAGVMLAAFPLLIPGQPLLSLSLPAFALIFTQEGLRHAAVLSLRVLTSLLVVSWISCRTPTHRLFRAFRDWGLPDVLTEIMEFGLRYASLFSTEASRLMVARKSRGFSPARSFWGPNGIRAFGLMLGVLMTRTLDRAQRVHRGMMARGYPGRPMRDPAALPTTMDLWRGAAILGVAVLLYMADKGWLP